MNPTARRLPLTGYSDRLSARAGGTIEFKISLQDLMDGRGDGTVQAWVTRSISADPNPDGPGIIEHPADEWFPPASFAGRHQTISSGSYGRTNGTYERAPDETCVLGANVLPLLHKQEPQAIMALGSLALVVTDGALEVHDGELIFRSSLDLPIRRWHRVEAHLDPVAGRILLSQGQVSGPITETMFEWQPGASSNAGNPVMVAAIHRDGKAQDHFNGKIESPHIAIGNRRVAWNFQAAITTTRCPASTGQHDELHFINFPTRAMTGSNWNGSEMAWRHAPDQYGAIHFHETDLSDAQWTTDLVHTVPDDCPSGTYILHIQSGAHFDAMPFFVCPPLGKPRAKLCLLVSTFTYLIYGNHARPDFRPQWKERVAAWDAYPHNAAEYPGYGLSTYNFHPDGSGICHGSHLRPLLNLRPGYLTFGNGTGSGLRHMQADSHLIAWLHHHGIDYDIVTDQELHDDGVAAIADYECIVTGTHPEYHTRQSLDALQTYRDNGGHLLYLGGNGFYWKIVPHEENAGVFEIRRAEDGIRAWAAETGEYYHAFDGSYGGLWRRNGRPPQMLAGVGFSAQGEFNGSSYRRVCHDDEHAWVFEGVTDDIIGAHGLSGGGAAGFELDRADARLGTPADAVVLASSEGHGDDFILVPEERLTHLTTWAGVPEAELIRADMIYCELSGGGSIFSTGSITFCGSLPTNGFDNDVSRILLNVVRRSLIQR